MKASTPLTVGLVHARHGEFVWKALYRMGVRSPHLEDVYQEVFLVVHRRLGSFLGHSHITSWLHEICRRVASTYRRRAHFRYEVLLPNDGWPGEDSGSTATPEREIEQRQAAARVQELLAGLNSRYRVVFMMFELEGLTCEQISARIGVPTGAVRTRLRRARKAFALRLERQRAKSSPTKRAVAHFHE